MTRRAKSLIIDRVFRDVGRIKLASGTTIPRTFRRINEMLSDLAAIGRLDLLRAIRDRDLTPMRVFEAWGAHDLDRLPGADDLLDLRTTMRAWIARYECAERTRESYRQAVRYLAPEGEDVTVAELPARLEALRASCQASGQGRTFNITRSAAQSFVRATRKKHSRLWLDVSAVEPLPVTAKRVKHPMAPPRFVELWYRLPADVRADAWTLAHTGMRPAEYWGVWSDTPDRIHIAGTKTRQSVRDVPRILRTPLARPQTTYRRFREVLSDVTLGTIEPYDLRRSFANWMEGAGIERTRRRIYLGHGAQSVTDRYEWHETAAHLAADAALLRNYLVTAILGPTPVRPEQIPAFGGVPPFATHSHNAPPRNRTENLLIKSRLQGGGESDADPEHRG